MKRSILILLLMFMIFDGCNNRQVSEHQQKLSRAEENVGELFYQAYYLRSDTVFPKMCQQLNKAVVSNNKFWLQPNLEVYGENGSIQEIDWGFSVNNDILLYDGVQLTVCIEGSTIHLNKKRIQMHEIQKATYDFLFHPDSSLWDFTNREIEIDFFGKIENPMIPVALITNGRKGLSVEEWRFFFGCMNEIVIAFDNRMNEISLNKWNKEYKALPVEKRAAIWEIAGYNINLFLHRDCQFYMENFSLNEYVDSIRNLSAPVIEKILDLK